MTYRLLDWTPDDESAIPISMEDDAEWGAFLNYYSGGRPNAAMSRVIEIAREHGVVSILLERRYIDADWRSEHANFYSTTFKRYPSVAHRAHFFTRPLPEDLGDLSGMQDFYRGYTILRPLKASPIGRTMIAPPSELDGAARCEAEETVDLLGWPMTIRAMPFLSQDQQYMRCAHADLWMTLYHAYLRNQSSRRLPAEVQRASREGAISGRQIPSEGLTPQQMLAGMTRLGLSPTLLSIPQDREAEKQAGVLGLYNVLRRYVNSNLAPIVASQKHVWLIVAYTAAPSGGNSECTIYRHDDMRGPYLKVNDPWNDEVQTKGSWIKLLLPLPPKIYMTAERAEIMGRWWFDRRIESISDPEDPLLEANVTGNLSVMAYGISASDYKHRLKDRVAIEYDLARFYRLRLWPRNLWVVEAHDRRLNAAGRPSVLGEVIIDPTATQYPSPAETGILAAHGSSLVWARTPDHRKEIEISVDPHPYETGRNMSQRGALPEKA